MYSLLFHLRGERLEYGRAVGRVRPAQRIALPLRMPLHALDYKCWFYETAAARGSTANPSPSRSTA